MGPVPPDFLTEDTISQSHVFPNLSNYLCETGFGFLLSIPCDPAPMGRRTNVGQLDIWRILVSRQTHRRLGGLACDYLHWAYVSPPRPAANAIARPSKIPWWFRASG
jgi:hypothetical protein